VRVSLGTGDETPYSMTDVILLKLLQKTLSLRRMNAQVRARRQQAEARLEQALEGIPGSDEIFDAIVTDWILNVGPEDMNQFKVDHMKEAVQGVFEQGRVPNIADNQYLLMTNAFKQFVREYYGQAGGKRKKTRKHKKRGKKTRKH
jgi:hypothetical protein